jgi:hypothetical protein
MTQNWTLARTEPAPQAASLERWLVLNPLHWQLGAPLVYGGATLGFLLAGLLLRRSPAWRGWGTVTLQASLATLPIVGFRPSWRAPSAGHVPLTRPGSGKEQR